MSLRAPAAGAALLGAALLLAAAAPPSPPAPAPAPAPAPVAPRDRPGVFVLGIDGMDPVILKRLMDEGRMPQFSALAREGGFQPLGTVTPPQSPVAWSSFATGLDPGGHGIYDFVHRDPKTYAPLASSTQPVHGEPPGSLSLFGYVIPLGGDTPANNRSGTPFWDILQAAGVPVQVYRIPGNYPVPESKALTLSGMGTVDMRGEFGKYTWYTDDAFMDRSKVEKAEVEIVTVDDEDLDGTPDTVRTRLKGPPDVMHLKPGQAPAENQYLVAPLTVHIDPEQPVAWIQCGDAQAVVKQGEWTDWMQVSFAGLPLGMLDFQGIVRFYAKELRPHLKLYASPVNIDPSKPAQPIATPDDAAEELCEAIGFYWTQGFPEEINALKDGLFDDDDYEAQIALVHADGERMLDEALARFRKGGCTFMYLSDIDLQCHMEWRHGDPKHLGAPPHPAYKAEAAARHAGDIEKHYENCDRLLGVVRDKLPEDALLLVISDHGFQPQTREVHLNAWLREKGYLVLKDGKTAGRVTPPPDAAHPGEMDWDAADVDWSRTKAYGLGFNGLYLNLEGREARGSVKPADADALMQQISADLLALRDPKDGGQPVLRVDRSRDIYAAARRAEAPDLIVGYNAGYGCSDKSTLGEIGAETLGDNTSVWSGNHLMAPEVVPGILLSNRRLTGSGHALTDITVTLLQQFGLPPGEGMVGHPLFDL